MTTPARSPASDRFEARRACFEAARRLTGGTHRDYTIDGVGTFRLSFAGTALVPLLTSALGHLRAADGAVPGLTICLWDGASTGVPQALTDADANGGDGAAFPSSSDPAGSRLSCADLAAGLALHWTGDAGALLPREQAAPLLQVLHWWTRALGHQVAHAGAVGTEDGGVLLVGKGGSGKSTSALASMSAALRFAADDYCVLTGGPAPAVRGLYSSAKVDRRRLSEAAFLGFGAPGLLDGGKAVLSLHPGHADRLIAGFPLRALLAVEVTGGRDTALKPASPSTILRALAPSTILQLRSADARDLGFLARFVRRLPGYVLEAGTDLEQIGHSIRKLLGRETVTSPGGSSVSNA